MVFATDHPVGNKIMTDLYRKAAEREPLMRQEAKAKAKDKRSRDAGLDTLFDLPATSIPVESLAWDPTDSWDPRNTVLVASGTRFSRVERFRSSTPRHLRGRASRPTRGRPVRARRPWGCGHPTA